MPWKDTFENIKKSEIPKQEQIKKKFSVKSIIKIYFYRLAVLITANPNIFRSDSTHSNRHFKSI